METTLILGLLALLAIVVIFGIFWGASLRRQRIAGERQLVANREAAEKGAPGSTTAPAAPPPPPPPPAAPSPLADEPVAAAAPLDANPAALAADVSTEPEASQAPAATEITQLKGLGPKLAATLAELGYTRIDQIAALTPTEAENLDARLGAFKGRMARDRWIEQANLLVAGDRAGYEAQFGKLGG